MSQLILFNKPFGIVSQFTGGNGENLSKFISIPNIYAAGRLDKDSEGLLLLTDDGKLQNKIANPKFSKQKYYWVQVEGIATEAAVEPLRQGILLKDGPCKPADVKLIDPPASLWPRTPPVRYRASIPTSWLEITISEGKNRQVRRMTAAIGLPTLRLIRHRIGQWQLGDLEPGAFLGSVDI